MINMDQLSKEGKSFNWEKQLCEKCSCFMWGHGYVTRYFESFSEPLYMKRFRCHRCKVVGCVRPDGYWPFIKTPIINIFDVLTYRLSQILEPVWPEGYPRQRCGYWLRRFQSFFKMHFMSKEIGLLETIAYLKREMQTFFA